MRCSLAITVHSNGEGGEGQGAVARNRTARQSHGVHLNADWEMP